MDKRALKYENRRQRLRSLIEKVAHGNQAEFGRKHGYSRSQIGQFLSDKYNDGRSIGGNVADALEEKCELPIGWFDWIDKTPTSWPFSSVDPKQYWNLRDPQRKAIEGWVASQVIEYLSINIATGANVSPTVRAVLEADPSGLAHTPKKTSTPKKRKEKDKA